MRTMMLAVVLEATSRGVVTYAYPIAVRFCQSVLKQVHGLQSKHEKSQEPRVMLKKHFDTIQKSVFLVIDLGGALHNPEHNIYEQVSCRIGESRITGCYRNLHRYCNIPARRRGFISPGRDSLFGYSSSYAQHYAGY